MHRRCPPESKRAQGMPGAGRTHGPPATKNAGGSHHRFSQINRHSLRNGSTAYTRSPRCTGLDSHRRPGIITQDLIPASGDRDRTISPYALACSSRTPPRPSHPASNVRDDREAPLLWERDARRIRLICDFGKSEIFSRRGLNVQNEIELACEISFYAQQIFQPAKPNWPRAANHSKTDLPEANQSCEWPGPKSACALL